MEKHEAANFLPKLGAWGFITSVTVLRRQPPHARAAGHRRVCGRAHARSRRVEAGAGFCFHARRPVRVSTR